MRVAPRGTLLPGSQGASPRLPHATAHRSFPKCSSGKKLDPLNLVSFKGGGLIRGEAANVDDRKPPEIQADELSYPSDLTDEVWWHMVPLIPPVKLGGRKRMVGCREIVNGRSKLGKQRFRMITSVRGRFQRCYMCPRIYRPAPPWPGVDRTSPMNSDNLFVSYAMGRAALGSCVTRPQGPAPRQDGSDWTNEVLDEQSLSVARIARFNIAP